MKKSTTLLGIIALSMSQVILPTFPQAPQRRKAPAAARPPQRHFRHHNQSSPENPLPPQSHNPTVIALANELTQELRGYIKKHGLLSRELNLYVQPGAGKGYNCCHLHVVINVNQHFFNLSQESKEFLKVIKDELQITTAHFIEAYRQQGTSLSASFTIQNFDRSV